jgi:hypothetical protein
MRQDLTECDVLTARQRKAIIALLSQATVERAAQAVGVSRATLHRWLQQPEFVEALRCERGRLFEDGINRLKAEMLASITKLVDLRDGGNDLVALRASVELIRFAVASHNSELELRLSELESLVAKIAGG